MSQHETGDMVKHFYRASAADFMKISGSPVAYWIDKKTIKCFEDKKVGDYFFSDGVTKTGNNDKYLRYWWEVSLLAVKNYSRYRFHAKGGTERPFYGNIDLLVKWDEISIRHYKRDHIARITPEALWDKEGITWSDITSGKNSFRILSQGEIAATAGPAIFKKDGGAELILDAVGYLNTKIVEGFLDIINPTYHVNPNDVLNLPFRPGGTQAREITKQLIEIYKSDWDRAEVSFKFSGINTSSSPGSKLESEILSDVQDDTEMRDRACMLIQKLNEIYAKVWGLDTVGNWQFDDLNLAMPKTTKNSLVLNIISYAVGSVMGRYSPDKPGLILASQGETLRDFLREVPSLRFTPDDDAILPLTEQEWFTDDSTNRFHEFVQVVWGDDHLQENLDFIAESLCLHAIKPKRGESALDTIRRYLSTQFYKDHLRTYKKRPIYWLFSSGKHKAFECLVYLHRYNKGTLARMRTEYVIPLSAKLNAYAEKLEQDKDASNSAAETKRLEKEIATLHKQQAELAEFDEKLRHYADQRISLDLDDGVKVNYGKFGDLLAEVKSVTGQK
jgi:hypothetical protein